MGKDNTNSNSGNSDFDVDSFFGSLEREVNGAVFDDHVVTTNHGKQSQESNEKEGSDSDDVGNREEELKKLEKRYEDSSKEAKRLYNELKKYQGLDDYVPLLEAMRQDPGLINHVKSYLDSGGMALPDDFHFDPEEAFTNPKSDSAKYMQRMIDSRAQAIVNERLNETTGKLSQKEMIKEFQNKHKLSDEQVGELLEWGNQTQMSLDDLLYLKNKGKNEENAARRAKEEIQQQLAKMKNRPGSLASLGVRSEPDNEEKEVFKHLLNASGNGSIFGKI